MVNEMMRIESMKHITKIMKLEKIEDPEMFYVPLSQHIGESAKELVSKGDYVKQYEIIGELQGKISSFIHSPVSGEVIDIVDNVLPNRRIAKTIVIKNDLKYDSIELDKREIKDLEKYSKEALLEIIRNSGIVGKGGAQFPTYVKYDIENKNVDTFIINGAECEPYLTADYSTMKYYAKEIMDGIKIIKKMVNPKQFVIGIEDENRELKDLFEDIINSDNMFTLNEKKLNNIEKENKINVKIQLLPTAYPQGSELQLIHTVAGKKIKKGDLPINSGIIVNNVGTVKAIYDVFTEGKPLIERVVTVSGEKISKLGNYIIKIGTTLKHIKEILTPDENSKILFGGPMMGNEISDDKTPVIKGTSGILFLETEEIERNNCISCGYCVEVCPMGLMPLEFAQIHRKGKYKKLAKANIMNCIECGACEYACPSRVPLIESIKTGKAKFIEIGGNNAGKH